MRAARSLHRGNAVVDHHRVLTGGVQGGGSGLQLGRVQGLDYMYGTQFYRDLDYVISDMNAPAMHWWWEEKTQETPQEVKAFNGRCCGLLEAWGSQKARRWGGAHEALMRNRPWLGDF